MSSTIRVRVATTMFGAAVDDVIDLSLTPQVQAAVDDGRLVPVEDQPEGEVPELKGEALDQALRDRDLSTSGTADEKRERLAAAPTVPAVVGMPGPVGGAVPGAPSTPPAP